ncbi:hypothetical protein BGX31_002866, partial [Mortierella sp. GBA43]
MQIIRFALHKRISKENPDVAEDSTPQSDFEELTLQDDLEEPPQYTPIDPAQQDNPTDHASQNLPQASTPKTPQTSEKDNSTKFPTPTVEPHPPLKPHPTSSVTTQAAIKVCNILLLGPTQSGKSTFLEYVRQYADPSHKIDETYIGYGNNSHTTEPRVGIIETTLPEYKLYEDGMEYKYSNIKDLKAIKKFLARDDDLELR